MLNWMVTNYTHEKIFYTVYSAIGPFWPYSPLQTATSRPGIH